MMYRILAGFLYSTLIHEEGTSSERTYSKLRLCDKKSFSHAAHVTWECTRFHFLADRSNLWADAHSLLQKTEKKDVKSKTDARHYFTSSLTSFFSLFQKLGSSENLGPREKRAVSVLNGLLGGGVSKL